MMDTNLQIFIVILLALLVIVLYCQFIYNIIKPIKKEKPNEIIMNKRIELLLTQEDIVKKINKFMSEFIEDAANTYLILNVGNDKETYINQKEIEEMTLYIKSMVKKNISPEILSIIQLCNNVSTAEEFDQYLDLKVKLYMIAIVVDKNGLIE